MISTMYLVVFSSFFFRSISYTDSVDSLLSDKNTPRKLFDG